MVTSVSNSNSSGYANLSGSSTSSNTTEASGLLETYLKQYIARYDKDCDSAENEKRKEMIKDLLSKADTNKDSCLSLDELSKVDTTGNTEEKNFVNKLISEFKTLDKDGDGVLSISEMQTAILKKGYSVQEISEISKSLSSSDDSSSMMHISSASFLQTLLNNYKQNDTGDLNN